MIGLAFDQNVVYRHWLYERLEVPFLGYDVQTISVIRNDEIAAVIAYYNFTKRDCFIAAAAEGFWLTKSVIQVVFRYPFVQLECKRITAICNERNERSIKLVTGLGFKQEGRVRDYYESADALVLGLLKHECRYL